MRIKTPRLVLRLSEEKDCAFITRYFQNEDVIKQLVMPPCPFTYADAHAFYLRMKKADEAGRSELFTITDPETDELMGNISFHPESTYGQRKGVAEMGYWLGKPFWRQGYMHEAAGVMVPFSFEELGWQELVALTNTDNQESENLLRKLGFTFEGERTPPKPHKRGTPTDHYWTLKKEDFEGSNSV